MLRDNREHLDEIALFLLTKETITGDEFMSFLKDPEELPASNPMEEPKPESQAENQTTTEETPAEPAAPEHTAEEPSDTNE